MSGPRRMIVGAVALGVLVLAACTPVAAPPPPPQVTSCDAPVGPDGRTDYFAVVEESDRSTRTVAFDAGSAREKEQEVAVIEATEGDVVAVEVDWPVHAAAAPSPGDDPEYANQWGVDAAGFPTAWDPTHASSQGLYGTTPVRVAVLDTGVHQAHEDLGAVAVVPGIDEVGVGDATVDPNGHGTHVAGILGARDNVVGGVGGAPEVEILPVRVLNAQGSGSYSAVINGISDAVTAGADVISMSLGGGGFSQTLQNAVNDATAAGVVVFAAAGNDGTCSASYPAALNGVLSVAAIAKPTPGNPGPLLATYSQRGPAVDLAAPGSAIRSTLNTGGYGDKSGTSMATPFAAAAAALLLAKCPAMTPAQVEARLESTATPIAGSPIQSGSGAIRIDLATAAPC